MIFYPSSYVHLYGFGNRLEGRIMDANPAREIIILPSIILPLFLLKTGQDDHDHE